MARLFSAGSNDKFAHAVARINRALTTESYRTGDVEHAGLEESDTFPADPRQLEHQPVMNRDQPYFEVLVVESMTEAQERALRSRFEQRVSRLTVPSVSQPDFSGFHEVFRDPSGPEDTPEGDVRRAFYLSYNDANCEYLTGDEIFEKLDAGTDVVSATFVTPCPPGFPVLVPGQVFSREILSFIRDLDTPEIHGYRPDFGYRVYTDKAVEMSRQSNGHATNGHRTLTDGPPEPASAQA